MSPNYTAESVEFEVRSGWNSRSLGPLLTARRRARSTSKHEQGTVESVGPRETRHPLAYFPALTPKPERGTLKRMVVACALGASIPAGFISLQNNRLLYDRKSMAIPRPGKVARAPHGRSKGLSVGPWRRASASE